MALSALSEKFWDEKLWLPNELTWKDLQGTDPNLIYPKSTDLYITLVIGIALLVLRYIFETFIVQPIGIYFGVSTATYKAPPNATLESAYLKKGRTPFTHKEITGLAKQLDWSERKVQRWVRKRRLQNAPTNMKKFRECSYQFVFYTISSICGVVFLWDKEWLWDTRKNWEGWPNHPVTVGTYWYYMIEMGFYISLIFSSLLDSKKKDFYEMFLHHLITLGLMSFSWSINFTHIGTSVLVLHDIADPWLLLAKMTKYAGMQATCEVLFTILTCIWISTRVFYYPVWILYTCLVELPEILNLSIVVNIFQGFMVALQLLHILWTFYIVQVALQRFTHGELTHDTRSDSEGMSDSEDESAGDAKPSFPNNVKTQNSCSKDG